MQKILPKKTFYYKFYVFLSLFMLGGTLHYCIFAFISSLKGFVPKNIVFSDQFKFLSEITFLVFEFLGAIITPLLLRFIGLKKTLLSGLFIIILALICSAGIYYFRTGPINVLSFFWYLIDIFLGLTLAITHVSIISYIIFEMSKGIGGGILTFYAFTNIGSYLIYPFISDIYISFNLQWLFLIIFILLMIFSIWLLNILLIDPILPKHIVHLRKGTLVWKELHYRLGLFLLAVFIISLGENAFTFFGWGKVFIIDYPFVDYPIKIISLFWIFTIISKLVLSFISIFIDFKKIFYFMILMIISALYLISYHPNLQWLIVAFFLGALGCSAVFAIMITELEKELKCITKKHHKKAYLIYIEFIIAWMIAAYWLGDEIGFLHLRLLKNVYRFTTFGYFKLLSFLVFAALLLIIFLFYTSFNIKKKCK